MIDPQIKLAKWMAQMRVKKGLSQEQLGIQIGKGQSDIAKLESGRKKITVLELANWINALNLEYESLEEILKPIFAHIKQQKSIWESDEDRT